MKVLIPVSKTHLRLLDLFRKYSNNLIDKEEQSEFIFVGNEDVQKELANNNQHSNEIFINEKHELFGEIFSRLYKMFVELKHPKSNRIGWYFLQFIKMSYCFMTDLDYLIWDVDTIPLKKLLFIDEYGRTLINKQYEHHMPYFHVIDKLFNNELKHFNFSFITESMYIRNAYMKELINKIGGKDRFIENIMVNVLPAKLNNSGFSEYETYGTYVMNFYPETMAFHNWRTKRQGAALFGYVPSVEELNALLLSANLDTISFENWNMKKNPNALRNIK